MTVVNTVRTSLGYKQLHVRDYIMPVNSASLDQVHRMFGHHRGTDPESPDRMIGEGRSDAELEAELYELETAILDEEEV